MDRRECSMHHKLCEYPAFLYEYVRSLSWFITSDRSNGRFSLIKQHLRQYRGTTESFLRVKCLFRNGNSMHDATWIFVVSVSFLNSWNRKPEITLLSVKQIQRNRASMNEKHFIKFTMRETATIILQINRSSDTIKNDARCWSKFRCAIYLHFLFPYFAYHCYKFGNYFVIKYPLRIVRCWLFGRSSTRG